jgi:response regulator RpfG family c-di-GMP phosphodiesterase
MRPADTTRADLRPEPAHYATLNGVLQGPVSSEQAPNHIAPKTILLYDGDERHRDSVALHLRKNGFRVVACDSLRDEPAQVLEAALHETDLVLFDLTFLNHHAWNKLMQIDSFRRRHEGKPDLACKSIDRGPEFRHFIEHILGADGTLYGQ